MSELSCNCGAEDCPECGTNYKEAMTGEELWKKWILHGNKTFQEFLDKLCDSPEKDLPFVQAHEKFKQQFLSDLKKVIEEAKEPFWWSACGGCPEGHSSFWKTVLESRQWQLWSIEQNRRMHLLADRELPKELMVYDMPEVECGGIISQRHFQDFMKFIKEGV